MHLIIVESPTKAKTISKFLGPRFKVESSFGHVRDLPEKQMGVDIKNNFEPEYKIIPKAKDRVANLKSLAKKADKIILATDEDREGEAIAWHLVDALDLKDKEAGRIVFHEITKGAIEQALKNPRSINTNLVDAQQARRVLDRLVGYELSPFLWKKVAKGLSAGRVQSVALRLVVEREREIQNFVKDEYWTIQANLKKQEKQADETIIKADLHKINGKSVDKLAIKNQEEAEKVLAELGGAKYSVIKQEKRQALKAVPKPFTTSLLQQSANRFFGMSAKQTMTLAQKLYENGFITYMRTDSFNLSEQFMTGAREWLTASLGEKYALATPRRFKIKAKGAQEAHEAIRPTDPFRLPDDAKLTGGEQKLYKLIWQRSIASQMPEAIFEATTINIGAKSDDGSEKYEFKASGQVMKFDGFLKIYPEKKEENELPETKEGEALDLLELKNEQHFTKPPARYSDAGLVKALEAHGIGRPSTYAPTIATIETRNYVQRDEEKRLAPTEIAFVVIDLLVQHFPEIVGYEFTAKMEEEFDDIARGKSQWKEIITKFYWPFHENLKSKEGQVNKKDIMPEQISGEKCDKCGADMVVKQSRYGKFLACSGFPECRNIKKMGGAAAAPKNPEKEEAMKKLEEKYAAEKCEKCGSPMVVRSGRYGLFLACSSFPKCRNIKNMAEGGNSGEKGIKCPVCGEGEIVAKKSKRGIFWACNRYPDCKTAFNSKPIDEKCPECGSVMLEMKDGTKKCSNKDCK